MQTRELVMPDGTTTLRPIPPESESAKSAARERQEKDLQAALSDAMTAYQQTCAHLETAEVNLAKSVTDQKEAADDVLVSDETLMLKNSLIERARSVYNDSKNAKQKAFQVLDDRAHEFRNAYKGSYDREYDRLQEELAVAVIRAARLAPNKLGQAARATIYNIVRSGEPMLELSQLAIGEYSPRRRPMWDTAAATTEMSVEFAADLLWKWDRLIQFKAKG